jgi:hypothetical protein
VNENANIGTCPHSLDTVRADRDDDYCRSISPYLLHDLAPYEARDDSLLLLCAKSWLVCQLEGSIDAVSTSTSSCKKDTTAFGAPEFSGNCSRSSFNNQSCVYCHEKVRILAEIRKARMASRLRERRSAAPSSWRGQVGWLMGCSCRYLLLPHFQAHRVDHQSYRCSLLIFPSPGSLWTEKN